MTVKVEDPAPDFELPGRYDREAGVFRMYRLSEALRERPVVLHFFPAPFTRTCEAQMCAVRDRPEPYEGMTVWGVTAHAPAINAAWARQHRFGVPILSDYDREASEAYVGTYDPAVNLSVARETRRGVVGVGTDGIVRYVWRAPSPDDAPPEQVIAEAVSATAT